MSATDDTDSADGDMDGGDIDGGADGRLVFASDLDAPPDRVWRAVTTPDLRDRWLPDGALADPEPVSETPGEEVSYRMRDDEPPYLESIVVFQIRPGFSGHGTQLRIIHRLTDWRTRTGTPTASNSNCLCLLAAA